VTHPSPAFAWILLGLPLGIVLFGVFLFLGRWLRLRPRSGAESEELLLGAVSQSLQERGQLAASLGELRTVHERLLDALPSGILWVDQRQRLAALNAPGRELLRVKAGVIGLDERDAVPGGIAEMIAFWPTTVETIVTFSPLLEHDWTTGFAAGLMPAPDTLIGL